VYVANKAYLKELSKVWATENGSLILLQIPFLLPLCSLHLQEMWTKVLEQLTENHPQKKLLTPEEAAETVYFLVNAPHNQWNR